MVQNGTAKIGVLAAVDGGSGRGTGTKHMRAQLYAYGGKGGGSDHACHLLVAYGRAVFWESQRAKGGLCDRARPVYVGQDSGQ